jgi:glycosyltransferase involved in cell wall biosynthesis
MQDVEISIGILAHNEEPRIGAMLQTLFKQNVFQRFRTEFVVVANGCTDETAMVARRLISDHRAVWSARGLARVEEVAVAGKANAWNQFVHKFSSSAAPILVLMDADISLLKDDTLSSMIKTLEENPEALVCVDRPVKDIEIDENRTLLQRLLLAVTPKIDPEDVPLCGQLYCTHSSQLRLIKLPTEIAIEDGFIRALLLTHGFTKPENRRHIVLDTNAAHSFKSVSSFRELFKHEVWVVAGSIVNMLLFERFWAECTPNRSATALMKEWHERDPDWLPRFIQAIVRERGWHLLPRHWWKRRWPRLRNLPVQLKLRRFPAAAIASAVDALIFILAIRDVRRGRAFRYWGRT